MTDAPQILLAHHLKALKLPTFLRDYDIVTGLYLSPQQARDVPDRDNPYVEKVIKHSLS